MVVRAAFVVVDPLCITDYLNYHALSKKIAVK